MLSADCSPPEVSVLTGSVRVDLNIKIENDNARLLARRQADVASTVLATGRMPPLVDGRRGARGFVVLAPVENRHLAAVLLVVLLAQREFGPICFGLVSLLAILGVGSLIGGSIKRTGGEKTQTQ